MYNNVPVFKLKMRVNHKNFLKNLKKCEKDYQHFGLRNAVYYEGWEFASNWDGYYGEFG